MTARNGKRTLTSEAVVWIGAVTAAYATFTSFEPLYRAAAYAAAKAGYENGSLFPKPFDPAGGPQGNTPAPGALLNIRGSFAAGQGAMPAQVKREVRKVTLAANTYGHFHAQAAVNGGEVEFMTDTGATYVALTYETAQGIGIPQSSLKFSGRSTTANGVAKVASVVLESVRIEGIVLRDVQAVVAEPGKMTQNLLGMSFISRLSGFELAGSKLVMTQNPAAR